MTDLDQSQDVIAVADLIRGRVAELRAVWCRPRDGHTSLVDLLNQVDDLLDEEAARAQAVIDADDLWGPLVTDNRLRATSAGEG